MKEKKKGSPLIALSVVLVLLIYGAAGFGVYKFKDQIKEFVGIEPMLSEAAHPGPPEGRGKRVKEKK